MSQRVLAVFAHPDDIEFVAAGTMLLLRRAGWELFYLTLADGCCGSLRTDRVQTARIRAAESQAAAESLGAKFLPSLCHDLEIFYDRETLARVAAIVRSVRPAAVLTHSPDDYMEDHQNACRLAVTAAFSRGMPNFPTQPPEPSYDEPVAVYHAQPHGNRTPLGEPVRPHFFVDVSDVVEDKAAALACHASQKAWLDASQGFDSYLQTMRDLSAEVGDMSGRFRYAEGWRRRRPLGFSDEDFRPLETALAAHLAPA